MKYEDTIGLARAVLDAYADGLRAGVTHTEPLTKTGLRHERNYVGLSQAGKCQRQVALGLYPGIEKSAPDLSSLDSFHQGNLGELDIRATLKAGGLHLYRVGWALQAAPDVAGHIDGAIRLLLEEPLTAPVDESVFPEVGEPRFAGDPHCWALAEIKTMRAFPFQRLIGKQGMRNTDPPTNVYEERDAGYILNPGTVQKENLLNFYQIQAYLEAAGAAEGPGSFPCAVYIGRDRDGGKVAVEVIEASPEHGTEALLGVVKVADSLRVRSVPPRRWAGGDLDPTDSKGWMCQAKYCPVRDACVKLGGDAGQYIPAPDEYGRWEGEKP